LIAAILGNEDEEVQWAVSVVCWEAERGLWPAAVGKEMGTAASLPKGWVAGVRKGRHL